MLIIIPMPRPCCPRRVAASAACARFEPAGARGAAVEALTLGLDELESLRLADLGGLHHEAAAREMGVSRPTFGRIVEAARRKVAQALVEGRALRIVAGPVILARGSRLRCGACAHEWSRVRSKRPPGCPACAGRVPRRRARARPDPVRR